MTAVQFRLQMQMMIIYDVLQYVPNEDIRDGDVIDDNKIHIIGKQNN